MRILYMIDEMEAITAGGTERQVLQMIQLMQQAGAQVQLCTLRGTEWLNAEQAGCPVKHFQLRSWWSVSGMVELRRIYRWMRAQKIDILQTFFVEANIVGPTLGHLASIPVILGSRRNLNYWMTGRQLYLQKMANRVTKRLVANCRAVKDTVAAMEKVDPARIDVLYNGLDTQRFMAMEETRKAFRSQHRYSDGEIVIGMVAVLRAVKGCEVFIDAAAEVARSLPAARFVLVGDGPLRETLERRAEAGGLGNRLSFAGSVEDIRAVLSAFDIAVLSSDSEGFSNSILEYLAMSLPTVVTDVGGNAEAVGGAGEVVPAGNPMLLAASILKLAKDDSARRRLSAMARARALDFRLEKVGAEMADYYQGLLRLMS